MSRMMPKKRADMKIADSAKSPKAEHITTKTKEELNRMLFKACDVGDLKGIKDAIKQGADIKSTDEGETPLIRAVVTAQSGRKAEAAMLLIENGAEVDARDSYGCTALEFILLEGDFHELYLDALKTGLADPKAEYEYGETPLSVDVMNPPSANVDLVGVLLENGADIFVEDEKGTLLQRFFEFDTHMSDAQHVLEPGYISILRTILDTHHQDIDAKVGIHMAAKVGDLGLVMKYAQSADINSKDHNDETPLWWAVHMGHYDVAKYLIENGARFEDTDFSILHLAVGRDDYKLAKLLIDSGCPLDSIGEAESTPLFWAVEKGQWRMVQLLLESGANANIPGPYIKRDNKKTPLEVAELEGHSEIAGMIRMHLGQEDKSLN